MLLSLGGFPQNQPSEFQFWKLNQISGEAKLKGFYREYDFTSKVLSDQQKSTYLTGGLLINTKSSFLHPNFLTVDLNAGYYPETSRNSFNIIMDNAEVRTLKSLGIRGIFLREKKLNLIPFFNLDNSYQNREFITDVKSNSKQWGTALIYSNKILPLTFNYRQSQWVQNEIATTRKISREELSYHGRANKSFTSRDRHELNYKHNEYMYQDLFINNNENLPPVKNTTDDIRLNNNILLGAGREYYFNSLISNFNQYGSRNYKRFQALESIKLRLPKNLLFAGNYNLNLTQQDLYKLNSQGIQTSMNHKLYQSLSSTLFYEYNHSNNNLFTRDFSKVGIDLQYTKKIPTKGQLSLSYQYSRGGESMNSGPASLQISNEEYMLTDGLIILIKSQYVNKESVIVRDATGIITYQLNIDYILIDNGPYLQIIRIPGGLIANNTIVYIDYTSMQPGTYKYNTNNHSVAVNMRLFNGKWEVYYRMSTQDYYNLKNTEFQTLNYFTQNTMGSKLNFGFINGGIEYENYNSTLIPRRMLRYFIGVQKKYHEKISFVMNGNIRNYYLVNEDINQQYSDVNAKIIYTIFKQTAVNFDLMYRKQYGREINLDLISSKTEITSVIRQLHLAAGVEFYRRMYVEEKTNFKGTYISIIRKF